MIVKVWGRKVEERGRWRREKEERVALPNLEREKDRNYENILTKTT
jgi:hypothetical protein